jgi:hypothetical protein
VVTPDDLTRCFHLSDDDRQQIMSCRGHHNRLGFALQLSTVRYLGTFLEDPIAVPPSVLQSLSHQLAIHTPDGLQSYRKGEQREEHVTKICKRYGYGNITEPRVGFRMTRWLYGVCWTGTERPGALFDRAGTWLLAHKILLPGVTTLERFVVSLRTRVEARLYQLLTRGLTAQQKEQLQRLLRVPEGERVSLLDRIRSGPTRISAPAIREAIDRLNTVRALGISIPMKARIPSSRIASLARFANRAKAQAISRMPEPRRLATLVAFVHCLEATAQDEVLEVLEMLMHDVFGKAASADQKARLRTLKDLDESAAALAEACRLLLDPELPDKSLRKKVFAKIARAALENALERVTALIRPPNDVYYQELSERYRSVRGYLPHVLNHVSFDAAPAGKSLLAACDWLRHQQDRNTPDSDAPREVSTRPGSVTSCRRTAALIFAPTPFACSVICRLPFTGATCLPTRAGDTLNHEPICSPMRSGNRHARSSAARWDCRPIRSRSSKVWRWSWTKPIARSRGGCRTIRTFDLKRSMARRS